MNKLYRCFNKADNAFLFLNQSLFDADMPEFLKMIQMNGGANYEIDETTGSLDQFGKRIYENDIILNTRDNRHYRVVYDPPTYVMESFNLAFDDQIDPASCQVVGNIWENPDLVSYAE